MSIMDFGKLLSKAQEMQEKVQGDLRAIQVEASAGGGMVKVKMNGLKQLTGIALEPEAIDPSDPATLEGLILAAIGEASRLVEEQVKQRVGQMGSGFQSLLGL